MDRGMRKTLVLFFSILVMASSALAAPAAETTGSLFELAGLRLIIALVLVVGIFLLFYAVSRKGLKFLPGNKSGTINVVEMRSLGPKKAIYLVEVRGRELLLGVGTERVELVADMGKAEPRKSFEDEVQAQMEGLE